MAQNKKSFWIFYFTLINIFIVFNVYAQSEAQDETPPLKAGYFIDNSGDTPFIKQRFVWEKEEYAMRYEISIQSYNNFYIDYIIENTEKTFYEVSLPPGFYRYSVTPFDLLGLRGDASEWKQFEVIAAYMPQIFNFSPAVFFLDRVQERILYIAGANIQPESKIYLSNDKITLSPEKLIINSAETAELIFTDKDLITGVYNIFILNPGELITSANNFTIEYRKPMDFFIKVAYTPVVPVYGGLKDYLPVDLFLSGYTFSFETISSKRSTFNGGLELSASVFFLNPSVSFKTGNNDYVDGLYKTEYRAFMADFDLNIALQKRFNNWKNAVTFRFGLGAALAQGFGNIPYNGLILNANAGVSALFRIYRVLHIEVGVDYSHHISENPLGLIKPRLGLVWKF